MTRVAVIGAGGWGTTLAALLAQNGHDVVLWALEPDVVTDITRAHENRRFLAGVRLPDTLVATDDLTAAVAGAVVLVSVVPSQFVGRVMAEARPHVSKGCQVVSASKGLETSTLRRMQEVLGEVLGEALGGAALAGFTVLSGPSFALEVARESPTLVVAASSNRGAAERVQKLFQNHYFRVYTNSDVIGVELGGALKNVIALAGRHDIGARLRPQHAGSIDHTWARGNRPPRTGDGGAGRNILRAGGDGRPRAHVHRRAEPEPYGGISAGSGRVPGFDSQRHERRGRGREGPHWLRTSLRGVTASKCRSRARCTRS